MRLLFFFLFKISKLSRFSHFFFIFQLWTLWRKMWIMKVELDSLSYLEIDWIFGVGDASDGRFDQFVDLIAQFVVNRANLFQNCSDFNQTINWWIPFDWFAYFFHQKSKEVIGKEFVSKKPRNGGCSFFLFLCVQKNWFRNIKKLPEHFRRTT